MKHPVETSIHSDSGDQLGFWYEQGLSSLQEYSH